MSAKNQFTLPPRIERMEMKFTIPASMITPISDFASVYCSPDKYSLASNDGYYKVISLYLDSPEFILLRLRLMHVESRFNLRIRSYGTGNDGMPFFFEIKHKSGQIIRKYRAKVTEKDWYRVFTDPGFIPRFDNNDPGEIRNRELFERMVFTYNASPKVLTQYYRKALVSDVDEYARVTFDRELKYSLESGYNLVVDERNMVSCDPETVFDPGSSVILELKCFTAFVPLWMIDLIRYFNLQRRSFSKYMTGIRQVLGLHEYSPSSTVAYIR